MNRETADYECGFKDGVEQAAMASRLAMVSGIAKSVSSTLRTVAQQVRARAGAHGSANVRKELFDIAEGYEREAAEFDKRNNITKNQAN